MSMIADPLIKIYFKLTNNFENI